MSSISFSSFPVEPAAFPERAHYGLMWFRLSFLKALNMRSSYMTWVAEVSSPAVHAAYQRDNDCETVDGLTYVEMDRTHDSRVYSPDVIRPTKYRFERESEFVIPYPVSYLLEGIRQALCVDDSGTMSLKVNTTTFSLKMIVLTADPHHSRQVTFIWGDVPTDVVESFMAVVKMPQ